MSKTILLTGAHAAAEAMRQINPDVVPVYPITPQTPIAEKFSQFHADGLVDSELVLAESEHSAMSIAIGASAAGARVLTASSSQGLALMWEMLHIASGLRLPIVMGVASRALSAPINIHCDHSDVMGCRDAGWIQIFSENVQEVYENTILATKIVEATRVPALVIQDGFVTSHCVENVKILDDRKVKKFVGEFKLRKNLLKVDDPVTFGALQLQDYYLETKKQQKNAMEHVKKVYIKIARELSKLTKNKYDYFEKYKLDDAEIAVVIAGSAAGTAKAVVEELREEGIKAGLLKIKLFRPFPYEELGNALKNIKAVAVLDRADSLGGKPPVYSDIVNSLSMLKRIEKQKIQSYVYGLGGRDLLKQDIKNVFEDLRKGRPVKDNYLGCMLWT